MDPYAPKVPPIWRRADICPANSGSIVKHRWGPIPSAKKDFNDPQNWVDPHLTVFTSNEPFLGRQGGVKMQEGTCNIP